jgi:prepilin-type N-terminal cleavage/methylation domain-containing protein
VQKDAIKIHRRERMKLVKTYHTAPRASRGFSLIELIVALAVALVLAAIAIPSIMSTYSQYRLGVQATLVANQIDLLRMSAVRKNTTLTLFSTTSSTSPVNTILYVDLNKNSTLDSTDPQVWLPADMQISNSLTTPPSGMPDSSSMGTPYATTLKLPTLGISFLSNGTISGGAGPYFIVIGYAGSTKYGFRAVTVTPMGEIKVWTATPSGSWSVTS